ncbi:hypothetical protein HZB00_00785 [Candidatus Woesearchaeota archaeon]|nr:hypothetical protein [Candidatus Woesearchaeota archaeon]
MNFLDAVFHLSANTAVHLGYIAVKFVVIFLSVFCIAWFSSISFANGLFTSFFGPFMFYIYYRMATPTLDRSIFTLDENVGYIFLHMSLLLIAYLVTYYTILKQKAEWGEQSRFRLWGVVGLIGLFYLFVPYAFVKQIGLHLELSVIWLKLLGAYFLIIGSIAHIHFHRPFKSTCPILHDAGFAFIAGSAAVVLNIGFHLLWEIGSPQYQELRSTLFTDLGMVLITALFFCTALFLTARWVGKSRIIGIVTATGIGIIQAFYFTLTSWMPVKGAILNSLVNIVIFFVVYHFVLKLRERRDE